MLVFFFPLRSCSRNQETHTLAFSHLAPAVHPKDSNTPDRGTAAISVQELHNGDAQPATKPAHSSNPGRAEDMDTDGEIDVDDYDDSEHRPVFF